jgi:MoxR-like ATPase
VIDDPIRREIATTLLALGLTTEEDLAAPVANHSSTDARIQHRAPGLRKPPFYDRLAWYVDKGQPVIFIGPTGSTKTTTIAELARERGIPLHAVQAHRQLTIEELRGTRGLSPDGGTTFEPGLLTLSLRRDEWFLIDEVTFADPGILAVIHNLLDGMNQISIPETGEVVARGPRWRFFATANPPGYAGTGELNQALLSRCVVIETEPCLDFEMLVLRDALPAFANAYESLMRQLVGAVREARAQGRIELDLDLRTILQYAQEWDAIGDPVESFIRIVLPKIGQPPALFTATREELVAAVRVMISKVQG